MHMRRRLVWSGHFAMTSAATSLQCWSRESTSVWPSSVLVWIAVLPMTSSDAAETALLPEVLRDLGYRTALVGKFHGSVRSLALHSV